MEIYELYGFLMNLLKRFSEQRQLKKTRKKSTYQMSSTKITNQRKILKQKNTKTELNNLIELNRSHNQAE